MKYLPIDYNLGADDATLQGAELTTTASTAYAKSYTVADAKHFFSADTAYTLPTPTLPAHNFLGWYTTETFDEGTQITTTEGWNGGSVYAKWEKCASGVQYELGGGSFAAGANAPAEVAWTETELAVDNPTLPNHDFAGWYTDADMTVGPYFGTVPVSVDETVESVTLYAKWTRTHGEINYVTSAGSVAAGAPTSFTLSEASTITLPEVTVTNGMFFGWYDNAEYEGSPITSYDVTAEMIADGVTSLTFYAKCASFITNLDFAEDLTSKNGSTTWPSLTSSIKSVTVDGASTPVMTIYSKDGVLHLDKTLASSSNWGYDSQFTTSGIDLKTTVLTFNFAVKRDAERDVMRFEIRPRSGDNKPTVFTIAADGKMQVGSTVIGYVTTEFQSVSVVCKFVDEEYAIYIDAYVDGVLACQDYPLIAKGVTAANLTTMNYYFDRAAKGLTMFDSFQVVDGEYIANAPETGSKIYYTTGGVALPENAPQVHTYGSVTTLPTGEEMILPGYTFVGWYKNAEFTGDPVAEIGAAETGVFELYAKFEGNYNVTYKVNGEATVLEKVCDITIPDTYEYWVSADGTVVAGGADVSLTANTTYYALTLDLLEGASIRMNTPTGLRFESAINAELFDLLRDLGYGATVGTLIVPTEKISGEFTKANLSELEIAYVNMTSSLNGVTAADGVYTYYASLTEIRAQNYTREMSAISYVEITVGETTYTVYSDYSAENNSRSVYEVAVLAYADEEADYSADERAIIRSFIDKVVVLDAELAIANNVEGVYTSPYVVSYAEGVLTVTLADGATVTLDDIATILIDGVAYTSGWSDPTDGAVTAPYVK